MKKIFVIGLSLLYFNVFAQDTIYQLHLNDSIGILPLRLKSYNNSYFVWSKVRINTVDPNCCNTFTIIKLDSLVNQIGQKKYYIDSINFVFGSFELIDYNKFVLSANGNNIYQDIDYNFFFTVDDNNTLLGGWICSSFNYKIPLQPVLKTFDHKAYVAGYGYRDSLSLMKRDIFLYKMDTLFQPVWGYEYETSGTVMFNTRIEQALNNSGIIILCDFADTTFSDYYSSLTKIDTTGNVLWSYKYEDAGLVGFYDIKSLTDGGFIICGYSSDTNQYTGLLFKIDSLGSIVWSHEYSMDGFCRTVSFTNDGGFIISGLALYAGSDRTFLLKTDSLGNPQWMRFNGHSGQSVGAEQTADGGYIYADQSGHNGGIPNLHIAKTDSTGNMGCDDYAYTVTSPPSLTRIPISFTRTPWQFTVSPATIQVDTTPLIDSVLCAGVSGIAYHTKKEEVLILYPNPNHGTFTIQLRENSLTNSRSEIINMLGELIYVGEIQKGETIKEIKLTQLQPGLFICRVIYSNRVLQRRFILE